MTMAGGTAVTPPSPYPADQNHSHPMYGFQSDQWDDPPTEFDYETIPSEVLMRRNANDFAYKQRDNYFNWNRYVMLGYFTFENCFDFDKLWSKMKENPLQVHRAIWYNFMYHVDRDLPVPSKLNAWATNISHPYLVFYDPTTLNETDTKTTTWNEMYFMRSMDVDETTDAEWIPVQNRRRSKSPPQETNVPTKTNTTIGNEDNTKAKLPENYRPIGSDSTVSATQQKGNTPATMTNSQNPKRTPPMTTVEEDSTMNSAVRTHNTPTEANTAATSQHSCKKSVISTNDGTHRITIKWTPPKDILIYESDKSQLNEAIYSLVKTMFPDEIGYLYRWESEDMKLFKTPTQMNAIELRDFISPIVTFLPTHSRMIFGVRFGFKDTVSMWRHSSEMKEMYQSHKKLDVVVSNSKSTSGNLTTIGYILLKAPNTTHIGRYTQYLRSKLPTNTPFFDIIRSRKTPMDQQIPHLAVQCGDKHTIVPLCQALLNVLTGRGSALFIPRYALSTMEDDTVKRHFMFHQQWTKHLLAIQLSPHINHLDLERKEYNEDGTVTVRSCREWTASLMSDDGMTPALCDVVNGCKNQKTYMVVPGHFLARAQEHLRQYKSRLHPPSHREARFRDNLQGLPDIITIQTEVQSNLTFLDHLSSIDIWNQAPPTVRQETRGSPQASSQHDELPQWPPIQSATSTSSLRSAASRGNRQSSNKRATQHSDVDDTTMDDRSGGSTKSLTNASQSTMQPRLVELERLLKNQQQALDEAGRKTSERLTQLEKQFHHIEELDGKMSAIKERLEQSNKQVDQKLDELKSDTTSQFSSMQGSIITTMESQHKISGTLLDMREQFDKMSTFIVDLAAKMEMAMSASTQRYADNPSQDMITARASSATKRAQPMSSNHSFSSKSSSPSHDSTSQDSSVPKSPEKKKLRPRLYDKNEEGSTSDHSIYGPEDTAYQFSQNSKENMYNDGDMDMEQLSETSDVCLNLDETLQRHLSQPASQPESIKLAPIFSKKQTSPHSIINNTASLDPQYNDLTDSAGAAKK